MGRMEPCKNHDPKKKKKKTFLSRWWLREDKDIRHIHRPYNSNIILSVFSLSQHSFVFISIVFASDFTWSQLSGHLTTMYLDITSMLLFLNILLLFIGNFQKF